MRMRIVIVFILLASAVFGQFIPNAGQWVSPILFKGEVANGQMYLEKDRVTYNLLKADDANKVHGHAARVKEQDSVLHFHSFQMILDGAISNPNIQPFAPSEEKFNYFLGNNAAKWARNLSSYQQVKYNEVYKGIDFLFYKSNVGPKYDFIVHPGADVRLIKLKYEGVNDLKIQNSELKIKLSFTEIIEQKPLAYQEIEGRKVMIPCSFELIDNKVAFKLGDYDKTIDLVIDPQLIFSTYSGATSDNFGYTATYDDDGFLYAGSSALGAGYPTTIGAYDVSFNSNPLGGNDIVYDAFFGWVNAGYVNTDIAITKYDTSGTKRIYSTFIGGELCEVPHSLVVNSKGELVIYGTTGSTKFPVTATAFDTTFGGGTKANLSRGIDINYVNGSDIIISKLSADGSNLLGSTYFGDSGNDGLNLRLSYNYADQMRGEVICDANDNIIIASTSYSNNISTPGTFQTSFAGIVDGVVAKFSPDLQNLSWSSYLGGSLREAVYSIVIDNSGDLVVAGGTTSNDLAVTLGVIQGTYQGDPSDGFIAKISNDGTTLKTLTYYGTSKYDQVYFVKVDKADNIFVYGQSASMDSSLIKNAAYYSVKSGMFISKLTNDLKTVIWSTTFGSGDGKINLSPTAFMVDLCSKVYLSGWGSSDIGFELIPNYLYDPNGLQGHNGGRGTTGLPVTTDAFQKTTDGSDFYIFVLEDDASAISYASFFGGNLSHEHVDGGTSRFDRKGKIYQSMCAGCGANSDMPIHPSNAVSPTNNSPNCNNGVFKMDFLIPNVIADFKAKTVCSSQDFKFENTSLSQKKTEYFWDFGDGDTSTAFEPHHIYALPGTYSVKLKLKDLGACNSADSIVKMVTVQSFKTENIGGDTICAGESTTINFTPNKAYNAVVWKPGAYLNDSTILHPVATPPITKTYALVGDDGVCKDTMIYKIVVIPSAGFIKASASPDSIVKGQSTTLHVVPSTWNVVWNPANSLNDFTSLNPIATPLESTTYTVSLNNTGSVNCVSSDSVFVFVYDAQCDEKNIYIPNVFTPNGDGKNDLLFVRGNNIKELYFTIYDRWGEKVFETTDQKIGWNGEYKNMSSDPAVFVYYLKVVCAGEKEFFTKGNITVLR